MVIKPPMDIDYENETVDEIVKRIEIEIEQDPAMLKVVPVEEYIRQEEALNKQRKFWDMY